LRNPIIVIESGDLGRGFCGSLVWKIIVDSGVDAVFIEIELEWVEFSLEVTRIPEEQIIKVFAMGGFDKAFDERMRNRN